jgi:predicted RNase H-like nuclease (RuvC/YqgF family)
MRVLWCEPLEKAEGTVIVTDTQAAEDAQSRRIRELEEENKAQCLEIERVQEEKKKLAYNIEWMAKNCRDFQAGEQGVSDAADEAEARCAHELHLLEEANRELDAENELIAKEHDAFQMKVLELETICEQQKATIQGFSEIVKEGESGG